MNSTFPRLLVRLEDLIFHADQIIPQICDCAGVNHNQEIVHHAQVSNRNHGIDMEGPMTGLIRSIIRYGNITNRRQGYPNHQLQAAQDILDSDLLTMFQYRVEEPTSTNGNDEERETGRDRQ